MSKPAEVGGTIECKDCGRYTYMPLFRRAVRAGRMPKWALELLEAVGVCRECGEDYR